VTAHTGGKVHLHNGNGHPMSSVRCEVTVVD
jgi:hypothetical protein